MKQNHTMQLNPRPFQKVLSGEKDIELRFFDEKRKKIHTGDTIQFIHRETKEVITCMVMGLIIRDSFASVFDEGIAKKRAGFDPGDNVDVVMSQYYGQEEIKKQRVVGIVLLLT